MTTAFVAEHRRHTHTHPSWVHAQGKAKRRSGPNPWEPVQPLLESIGQLFSVEALVIDAAGVCVAGTGPYKAGIGLTAPADTALVQSLRAGVQTMVLNPGEDDACRACSQKGTCSEQANYTAPVEVDGVMLGAVQIVAFDSEQRMALLEQAENTFLLIRQALELLCRTRTLLPPNKDAFPVDSQSLNALVGNSSAMLSLKDIIVKAAAAGGPALIYGESGTGKELVALAIHHNSANREGPFIPVNCGALPETLMESELFGYAPGAFSGAQSSGSKGLWEQADGGTIFLDEVGELPPHLQVKLLRTLQDGVVRRIGGGKLTQVSVRVLAATNKDLRERVRAGLFRQDLFYRLNVIPVFVSPLRERKEDIRALTTHFISQHRTRVGARMIVVDPALMRRFMEYHWPGNVRELRNFIEYGIHFSQGSTITWDILAGHFERELSPGAPGDEIALGAAHGAEQGAASAGPHALRKARQGASADLVRAALEKHGATVTGKRAAAKELGVSLATLYRMLK